MLEDTLSVDQVLINPEAKAHVLIEKQVSDSTTRHIDVSVSVPILEDDTCSATNGINKQTINGRRSAVNNVEAEHSKQETSGLVRLSVSLPPLQQTHVMP